MTTDRLKNVRFLTMDGEIIPFGEAKIHPLSKVMKYATSVFDAWRGYWNPEKRELYVFRLREHLIRLLQSAKIYQIPCPYTVDEMVNQTVELIRANEYKEDIHCRVILFVNEIDGGTLSSLPVSTVLAAMPMPHFLKRGPEGVHACVSSWRRISDEDMPPRAKAAANYQNARLVDLEALNNGYDSAIILDRNGKVTEGPAYSMFIVRNGALITPPVTGSILESLTRDTFITLFSEISGGQQVVQREIDRTELYIADEAFFCGSSAEATPILSVDKRQVGDGKMGPITRTLRETYLDLVKGNSSSHLDWLLSIYGR